MNILKTREGGKLTVALEGRLDTTTAPQLETELRAALDYISSAGLRVLLSAQKAMNKRGEMLVRNASADLMEIFEVTGFVDILNIE